MAFTFKESLAYFWQQIANQFVRKESGKGLSTNDYTTEDKLKVANMPEADTGATSVAMSGNGNAVTGASYDESTRKITLTKGATYTPTSRTINGKALNTNISLTASDVSAVPTTRTVNNKALSGNITLSASDVGAVPTTRTVNGKALSTNISLTASDVSALASSLKGAANGVATLDANSKVPVAQLPAVTTSSNGVMTAIDKVKLDSLEAIISITDDEIDAICTSALEVDSTLVDEVTGTSYRLYVSEGNLKMAEVNN